jgi:hypothetical protein
MSSDALKNAPFVLSPSIANDDDDDNEQQQDYVNNDEIIEFIPNEKYTKECVMKGSNNSGSSKVNVVKIPKDILGFVTVGRYNMKTTIDHMPLVSTKEKMIQLCDFVAIAMTDSSLFVT